jgi:ABC-2 type transport system ATP-binding protein
VTDMIRTSGLVKRYGKVTALDGLDLVVPKGMVLGLLGPNGAGKTTAVRILTTLLEPDEGTAEVAGLDVQKNGHEVRQRIGLSGQTAAVDEYLTGFENLDMVGRLYHLGKKQAKERAKELLMEFELDEAADRPAKTYSGGMRRRLDLAAALVAKPDVLFLDEPTTGLDPRSRAHMWDSILQLAKAGSTVLLTTQYMEEADFLAEKIVVIDRGRKIAEGTPDTLKSQVGGERIEIVLESEEDLVASNKILAAICGSADEVQVDEQARKLTAAVTGGVPVLKRVLQDLGEQEIKAADIGLRRPTLDDVFLSLTGHAAEEIEEESEDGEGKKPKGRAREKEAVR